MLASSLLNPFLYGRRPRRPRPRKPNRPFPRSNSAAAFSSHPLMWLQGADEGALPVPVPLSRGETLTFAVK